MIWIFKEFIYKQGRTCNDPGTLRHLLIDGRALSKPSGFLIGDTSTFSGDTSRTWNMCPIFFTSLRSNRLFDRSFNAYCGRDLGGEGECRGISGIGQNPSLSVVSDNIHTKFQVNQAVFRDGRFWADSPPRRRERGIGSDNGQNPSKYRSRKHAYQVLRQSDYISRN